MAWRVTEEQVRELIDSDPKLSVAPFIRGANALTDKVSARDSAGLLTTADLFEIEINLAAHHYEHRDPQPAEEKTGDARTIHQGMEKIDCCKWWTAAVTHDETGYLASAKKGKTRATAAWLGLPPSEQTAYVDRD